MAARGGGNPSTSFFWASDALLISQTSPGLQPPRHREQGQEGVWRTQLSHQRGHYSTGAPDSAFQFSLSDYQPHEHCPLLCPIPPPSRPAQGPGFPLSVGEEDSSQLHANDQTLLQVSFYKTSLFTKDFRPSAGPTNSRPASLPARAPICNHFFPLRVKESGTWIKLSLYSVSGTFYSHTQCSSVV